MSNLFYPLHLPNFRAVSKIIIVYHDYFSQSESVLLTLYLSSTLATTLWCTVFILFRMLTVNGIVRGAGDRLKMYRRLIEVLVQSYALYSIALVLFLGFFLGNNVAVDYFDVLTAIAKVRSEFVTFGSLCHLFNTLCRELRPPSFSADQRQDIRRQPKNMMKVRRCLPFVSRRSLRNLLNCHNLPRQAFKNPPCRAQSLKWILKLNENSRMSSW